MEVDRKTQLETFSEGVKERGDAISIKWMYKVRGKCLDNKEDCVVTEG